MQDPSKPIWMNKEPKRVELTPNYHIFVGMPVHSEMSIHTAQSLLELQKFLDYFLVIFAMKGKVAVFFTFIRSISNFHNILVHIFMIWTLKMLLFQKHEILSYLLLS